MNTGAQGHRGTGAQGTTTSPNTMELVASGVVRCVQSASTRAQ
jgi:hypothetical protein